ncbi:MAG TPA: helicase-related protein [Clostridia bacterium]|nr:helicase-related protein [Clostridia bacterium]
MSATPRKSLVQRLEADLVGPHSDSEILADRPNDVYLTGILFPQATTVSDEENESLQSGNGDDENSTASDAAPLDRTTRPASAGISFAIATDALPISATLECATYERVLEAVVDGKERYGWKRHQHRTTIPVLLNSRSASIPSSKTGIPNLELYYNKAEWKDGTLVTMAVINANKSKKGDSKDDTTAKCLYQVKLTIKAGKAQKLIARPSNISGEDDDAKTARLLYRNAREYATGHTCSADWRELPDGSAEWVSTSWIPQQLVPSVSMDGHKCFEVLKNTSTVSPLSADWLSNASDAELQKALPLLPKCYRAWISSLSTEGLDGEMLQQAKRHISDCEKTAFRIEAGIDLLMKDQTARVAFKLANRAMNTQRIWTDEEKKPLQWRPFQLAFILLNIPSLCKDDHPEREIMDLLWFPTGGGKTEAYLGILAFLLFFRRMRRKLPDEGAGVACIMRYTLRLLTTQQYERAAALILACELIRLDKPQLLGAKARFGIGMWVGSDSVPNDYETAKANYFSGDPSKASAVQLTTCPSCRKKLTWTPDDAQSLFVVRCTNAECALGQLSNLPVWTVDDAVYRQLPSLLVGTVDKFAQIVRNPDCGVLFGRGAVSSPDLIIQDELHLISGPLGTMAGLYEVAIDKLCSRRVIDGKVSSSKPKIIGSTATIRRAEPQVRALFGRKTLQFPPPGIDASDSCFCVIDPNSSGRLYLGVTTAGRSAKFALQATCASLLQSAQQIPSPEVRDPYSTLVTYFNSLRELGGAVVLMQDDVGMSIDQYAKYRDEQPKAAREVRELTSRVTQTEVRELLDTLKNKTGEAGCVDVLLASNMISVGVDIPRLGLMVVNGQPKGISEYIQSTSRVGRGSVAGLIVAVYNAGKARDRSHYETLRTWHRTLYREVDATSVTPFASRARDRALHAPLVALIRHFVAEMRDNPQLRKNYEEAIDSFVQLVVDRSDLASQGEETSGTAADLKKILTRWAERIGLKRYWNDYKLKESLLISAERAAELRACGRAPGECWPTPNSLRNVEPGTPFMLTERLAPEEELPSYAKGAKSGK